MWTVSLTLTQYYTATTLDGFIADADNSLDWLFTRNRDPDGPLSYGAFIADVGAMAMGLDDVRMGARPRVRRQGSAGVEVAVRDSVLGLHAQAAAGGIRGADRVHEHGRRDRARADGRGCAGPERLDRSAVETWSVSSPKRGCSTRSSCRSRRSLWVRVRLCFLAGSSCASTSSRKMAILLAPGSPSCAPLKTERRGAERMLSAARRTSDASAPSIRWRNSLSRRQRFPKLPAGRPSPQPPPGCRSPDRLRCEAMSSRALAGLTRIA